MEKGLIHVYTGNGKGKTTAVVGMAVRAAGRGNTVVFAQFLKSGVSGEIPSMKKLGIDIVRSDKQLGFTFNMDEATKKICRAEQEMVLKKALQLCVEKKAVLLVLDEVLDALGLGMLEEASLRSAIASRPEQTELALTGRPVPPWIEELADYYSEVKKIKHPFDRGVAARKGIED
jgi:cob(I)alamin adenosyltransferase